MNPTMKRPLNGSSARIAGLVGPTLLVVSSSEAVNMGIFLAQSAPIVYLNGTVLFVAGLAIVRSHPHWRPDWTILVTLTGWGALVLGIVRMAFPSSAQASQSTLTYVLLATLFIVGAVLSIAAYLPRRAHDAEGSGMKGHWAAWIVGAVAVGAGAIAIASWLFPTPNFPQPSGPHGIGTRLFYWTDNNRPEPFTPSTEDHRRLVVQVWYPSGESGSKYPYIDQPEVLAALPGRFHIPPWLLGNLQHAPTHAVLDGAPEAGSYPVLINPTGLLGFRAASLFWIEELVSQGYVVVTLDQPGTAAATVWSDGTVIPMISDKSEFDKFMPLALSRPSNKALEMNGVSLPNGIIPFLADDLSYVLDQLSIVSKSEPGLVGTLDLDRVGVFGMSLGGYIAAEVCYRDPRFRACLAADSGDTSAVVRDGLNQPVMLVSRDADIMRAERSRAGGWPESEIEHTISSQRAVFEHARGDAYYVTMNGMYHVNWTDAPIWSPLLQWLGLAGPIDPYIGFALTNECTRSFFDHYLRPELQAAVCVSTNDMERQVEVRLVQESNP